MTEQPQLDRMRFFAIAMERSMAMRDRGHEEAAGMLTIIGDLVVNELDDQARELLAELRRFLAASPEHPPVWLPEIPGAGSEPEGSEAEEGIRDT